jgi:chemotaxis protein MotB
LLKNNGFFQFLSGKDIEMHAPKLTLAAVCLLTLTLALSGCVKQEKLDDLKLKNRNQQERIDALESELSVTKLKLAQVEKQLADCLNNTSADTEALQEKINALQEDIDKKTELIAKLQSQLVHGAPLPADLTNDLQKFAAENEGMVEFDPETGVVKFKSDLLFELGSDIVTADAADMLKKLSVIINGKSASAFDVVVAGHTDDMPIKRADTLVQHPTNWHLSEHRAISVEKVLDGAGVTSKRMSVRGFGEFRPLEANAPNQKGNAKNRRVEIYLVPAGA